MCVFFFFVCSCRFNCLCLIVSFRYSSNRTLHSICTLLCLWFENRSIDARKQLIFGSCIHTVLNNRLDYRLLISIDLLPRWHIDEYWWLRVWTETATNAINWIFFFSWFRSKKNVSSCDQNVYLKMMILWFSPHNHWFILHTLQTPINHTFRIQNKMKIKTVCNRTNRFDRC